MLAFVGGEAQNHQSYEMSFRQWLVFVEQCSCISHSSSRSIKDIYNNQLLRRSISFQLQGSSVQDGTQNSVPAPHANPVQHSYHIPNPIQEIMIHDVPRAQRTTPRGEREGWDFKKGYSALVRRKNKEWSRVDEAGKAWVDSAGPSILHRIVTDSVYHEETSCKGQRTKRETGSKSQGWLGK